MMYYSCEVLLVALIEVPYITIVQCSNTSRGARTTPGFYTFSFCFSYFFCVVLTTDNRL